MMCCLDLMEKTMRTVCLSSLSLPFTRLFEAKKKYNSLALRTEINKTL